MPTAKRRKPAKKTTAKRNAAPRKKAKSLGTTSYGEKVLAQSQCCDLIEDDGADRRWRCRGDDTISEEHFNGRRWEMVLDHGR